jgi:hypothetical protein
MHMDIPYSFRVRTTVIVKQRGAGFVATVSTSEEGAPNGARIGLSPSEAAASAAELMMRWCRETGGDLLAPPEVLALVPAHLRTIDSTKTTIK